MVLEYELLRRLETLGVQNKPLEENLRSAAGKILFEHILLAWLVRVLQWALMFCFLTNIYLYLCLHIYNDFHF